MNIKIIFILILSISLICCIIGIIVQSNSRCPTHPTCPSKSTCPTCPKLGNNKPLNLKGTSYIGGVFDSVCLEEKYNNIQLSISFDTKTALVKTYPINPTKSGPSTIQCQLTYNYNHPHLTFPEECKLMSGNFPEHWTISELPYLSKPVLIAKNSNDCIIILEKYP